MPNKFKKINIPYIDLPEIPSPQEAMPYLANIASVELEGDRWPNYPHSVKTNFTIAHNGSAIFLKYAITEYHLLAKASTNGNIYEDSCVEFFVDLDNNGKYYNLEFNCLGWGKVAYGDAREGREVLDSNLVEMISSFATINSSVINGNKSFCWDIVLVIPLIIFSRSNIVSFSDIKAKGNFYKCGDCLPEPHYLVWNPVISEEPDFHRPECFGELYFDKKAT